MRFHRETHGFARAAVHAFPAQDAFVIAHVALPHHFLHIQAHRASFGTLPAAGAFAAIRFEAQRRQAERVAQFPAHDHEGSHPAGVVAKRAFPRRESQHRDEGDDDEIDDERIHIRHGQAPGGVVEEIQMGDAAGRGRPERHAAEPRRPDEILDPVAPSAPRLFSACQSQTLLQAAQRAHPAAEGPAEHEREQEQQAEHDHAARGGPLQRARNDEVGGKVVEDCRQQQE